ncbi:MAG: porin [Bacteroidales bacterium]|nr:porin [Bacteroidales bacterium]
MKRLLLSLLAAACALPAFAQGGNTRDGGPDGDYRSLYEIVSGQQKKNDAFNLYFNTAVSFQEGLNPAQSMFRAKQFRIEVKGQFGNHLTYRFRHRLNRAWWSGTQDDNFAKATDIIMLGWNFNEKWSIAAGKMCQIWGGFEFDENPMYIYQYSDFIDYMDNFMAGAMVSWHPVPTQEIAFMVSNSFNGVPAYRGFEMPAHPLTYILNWNGSLFDGLITTRWSVGTQTMAKKKLSTMVVLGQQLNLSKFQWYIDYMGEFDDIDRLGIVTADTGVLTDVRYHSVITKANWQFAPKWNLMGKGMFEFAGAKDLGNYRTSIGWVGAIEFYPLPGDQDLRFFLAYVGRTHRFSNNINLVNDATHRIELGFMYRIKAY